MANESAHREPARRCALGLAAASFVLCCAGAAQADPPHCTVGQQRQVLVGCRTGLMSHPPRTEMCMPSPRAADWYLREAALGARELGGTGGEIRLFALRARSFDRQATIDAIARAITDAHDRGDASRAQSLETLLQQVRQEKVPLAQADAVAGELTLRPYMQPHSGWDNLFACDANPTAGSCAQITVPPVRVTLVCLPQPR